MARKNYSCDFETTTKKDDCRVWAYGWMEIGNKTNYKIGNSIDEFMAWAEKAKGNLYFHNLKFDGSFIVNWLLKRGYKFSKKREPKTFNTLISRMGQWYSIEIVYGYKGKNRLTTKIYDSLKKLPFPVRKIAKDFKLDVLKGDIDYNLERPVGWEVTPEEHDYIHNDIYIVASALEIQFEQNMKKMTAGSDSLAGFKNTISKQEFDSYFPILSFDMDAELRKAYRGGFTWVNPRYQGLEIGSGMVYDVNSLYPSQMYYRDLPYGIPLFFDGEYEEDSKYPLYVQCLECEFKLKPGYIPTIQLKNTGRFMDNEYLSSSGGERVELKVTNIDLELIREHYELYDVEYTGGWKFMKINGLFNNFIDHWMEVKTNNGGAIKALAKLQLNSLYGKFGTNPNVTGKEPYLKDDGSLGFTLPYDEEGKLVEEFKDPVYIPMGIFITSWARYTTITTAQKCFDRIIYCDTDSIHLVGTEIPDAIKDIIDDNKLGYWKHESTFTRAKFLRQKTYCEQIPGEWGFWVTGKKVKGKQAKLKCPRPDVKCAGMPENIKHRVTFKNFEIGFSSNGKLVPKQVNGGVVLQDTEFTIK